MISKQFKLFSAVLATASIAVFIYKVGTLHVFDIGGNKVRLIAVVMYQAKRVYIRYVLSHKEYDKGHWKEG